MKKKSIPSKNFKYGIKKTGKLFEFCCVAPLLIKKNKKNIKIFQK